MSIEYTSISWNDFKKKFDFVLLLFILVSFFIFLGLNFFILPMITFETILIRYFSTMAFFLLHIILSIGPLTRINKEFLPLLYNRRHLGVTMFLLCACHAFLTIFQFHTLGNESIIKSLLFSYSNDYNFGSLFKNGGSDFPFEFFGLFGLTIFALLAVTSHDFWIKILGKYFWKSLHILVHLAYFSIIFHIGFGFIQSEQSYFFKIILLLSPIIIYGLHLYAWKIQPNNRIQSEEDSDKFFYVCKIDELVENRAIKKDLNNITIAIFLFNKKVYATGNVCAHQGGPISEGVIIDGCINCPWHGWQYLPETGISPPPFNEKIPTYLVKIKNNLVFVRVK